MAPVVLLNTALVAAFAVSGSIAGAAGRIAEMVLWMVSILLLLTLRLAVGSEGKSHWPEKRSACQPPARGAIRPMPTQRDYTVLTATVVAASGEDLRLTRRVAATEGEAERTAIVVAGPVAGAAGPVVAFKWDPQMQEGPGVTHLTPGGYDAIRNDCGFAKRRQGSSAAASARDLSPGL